MSKPWIDVAEEQGWRVDEGVQEGQHWFEFSQESPAGEDFSFTIWPKGTEPHEIAWSIWNYGFDVNEHVQLWAPSAGKNGTPDVVTLVQDAQEIEKMIDELYYSIRDLED